MEEEILVRRLNFNGLRILILHPDQNPQFSIVDFGDALDFDTPTPAVV